jgi:DNA-binding response OmpR family regulator
MRSGGFQHLIVGLTGHLFNNDVKEYLRAGADLVLTKPLNFRLLKLLLQHIHRQGPASKKGTAMTNCTNTLPNALLLM